jgi:hypothetical protein
MAQCHACRKQIEDSTWAYGLGSNRYLHDPGDCDRLAKAVKALSDSGTPPGPDDSLYSHWLWDYTHNKEALYKKAITFVESAPNPSGESSLNLDGFYLFSCAQVETPVHLPALKALETLASSVKAPLKVGALRYKNPNAFHPDESPYDYQGNCDPVLSQYLVTDSELIGNNLKFQVVSGATSLNPIAIARKVCNRNTVIAHPVRQLKEIATPTHERPLTLVTTGSVTTPYNYSLSSTGEAAEFHHTYGATMVEMRGGEIMLWPLTFDSQRQCVYWFDKAYYADGRIETVSIPALVMGDFHGMNIDPQVLIATKQFLSQVWVEELVIHDFIDFELQSHWNTVWDAARLSNGAIKTVDAELMASFVYLRDLLQYSRNPRVKVHMIASNHNEHLTKWLEGGKNHTAPLRGPVEDLILWHTLNGRCMAALAEGIEVNPLDIYLKNSALKFEHEIIWETRREPLYIEGVDLGQHGDRGVNGSKGSTVLFSRVGRKTMIGHGHYREIEKAAWRVPTSGPVSPDYQQGYSLSTQGHGAIMPGGKRQLFDINNGRFCLDPNKTLPTEFS